MLLKPILAAGRDGPRLTEILQIASRFGLDTILARLGLTQRGEGGDKLQQSNAQPARTRLALEELGPTFVKLGQILATRGDLLAPEWIAELEKLHSQAPALPFGDLRSAVVAALGEGPEAAFLSFDPEPLAAASMAQVHRATLHDGREVVLKIQRPGIRPRIEADLRLIAQAAKIVEAVSFEARRFQPVAMMRQLTAAVLEELDFTNEGRNADRLRSDFAHEPRVAVPEIHWEWSSETLLVMDYVEGIAPRDPEALLAAGIDPNAIAALGAEIVLDMVLVNGRFHGDPHPGNLLCLPGNRIALLDMGMIGHVSPRRRQEFIAFTQSLTSADPAQLADVLLVWSAGSEVPRERVVEAADRLVARHGGGRLVLSAMVADFLPLMREQGLLMPPDLLLIFKALITIDGVLTAIAPGFDLSSAMQGAATKVAAAKLSPEHWLPILTALAWEISKVTDDAPRLLRAAIQRLEGNSSAARAYSDPSLFISQAGNRIALAIVTGLSLIAGALLLIH